MHVHDHMTTTDNSDSVSASSLVQEIACMCKNLARKVLIDAVCKIYNVKIFTANISICPLLTEIQQAILRSLLCVEQLGIIKKTIDHIARYS